MAIRVGKYDYKTKIQPITSGYTNVLIHTSGDLSPYTMKDSRGRIMENIWQFSKIWETVYACSIPISQYMPNQIRWKHPTEIHLTQDGITKEYWQWRKKGQYHNKWVRYPNTFKHHSKCIGSVIKTKNGSEIIDYIEARKRIYFAWYKKIAEKTHQFKELKEMLANGINIQINEVDGPSYAEDYPFNLVESGSIPVTEEIVNAWVNDPSQAFGHGICLAAILLGINV